jgi:ecotin
MRKISAILVLFICFSAIATNAGDNMQAFPPPEKGQLRYVLQLPEQDDESLYKVELIVGRTVETDKTNQYFFGGNIIEETITGWGFPRYILKELGPMAGTLMAVDPNAPQVDRFIHLGGEPYLIRYNSRLPVVIYVPQGVEVRYRIWRTDSEMRIVKRG